MRTSLILSLAAGIAFVAAAAQQQPHVVTTCPNRWAHEPVLIYDVAGSTLAGPLYRHLVVYSSGHALISETSNFVGDGRVGVATLSAAEITQLRSSLAAAGAGVACDDPSQVSDVPLSTITVLRGGTDSIAHTSSYLAPGLPHAQAQQVIDTLITTHFPGF